jgi:ADP-ribosylglycohydrolase
MGDRDRGMGAYIGAAIGDAMGGPVECNHAARIKRLVGEITGLLPYRKPYTLIDLHPGYALRADPGAVTDDTFIRGDFTRFYTQTKPPRTPSMLAAWLLEHADFSQWWGPAVEALRRVERGEVKPEEGGLSYLQGGGIGWWTPIGILYGGDPERAAAEVRNLSRIWKAPLEQDLCAAVQAGLAEGMSDRATMETVIEAILAQCGPLATKLLQRAIDIALQAASFDELVDRLYQTVLVPAKNRQNPQEPSREIDGPLPPMYKPLEDSDDRYSSVYYAEQVPLAVAAFVYGQGEPQAIPTCCMLGRDCDSTATTVGAWAGALHGESGLPAEWAETVCAVNVNEIDIRGLAEQLIALPV